MRAIHSVTVVLATSFLCVAATSGAAQSQHTTHTLRLDDPASRPEATLADVSWLAATWKGHAFGGTIEEVWTEPAAGTMMGAFKVVVDGSPFLYELEWIVEEEGSLALKVKHFSADLTAWEDKAEVVDFPLVAVGDDVVYFDGLTYRLESPGCLRAWVALNRNGEVGEEELRYRKEGGEKGEESRC